VLGWSVGAVIGQSFGSYRAVREVGRGGMGVVYAAEHPLLGSQAVVKQLRPELSAQHDVIERFFNEARAASRIVHPGIVRIFDFGYSEDGTAYFVMEFLDGESVGARLAGRGPMPEAHAVRLARQIASALAAAHEAGIIHRDLKPDNVFLVKDEAVAGGERAKILDFGIAKLGGDVGEGVAVTRTGALLGSPLYMSPEQCRGTGEVDARADIYALGCLLFAMVTGRPPFLGQGVGEIIGKHIYEQPPRPRELSPGLSAGLDAVIMRALEKDPARRHASMRELSSVLEGAAPGGQEAPAPAAAAVGADDSANFTATADTILSTSPGAHGVIPRDADLMQRSGGDRSEAAPTIPAPSGAAAETPAMATTGSGTGRQQRTVAMWVAAALAAGMAGFFVLARVDDKGGGGGAGGGAVPAAGDRANSTADEPPPPTVPPDQAVGGAMGGGSAQTNPNHGRPDGTEPVGAPDAGVEEVAETAPPDAGPRDEKTVKKVAKKRVRPPVELDQNADSNLQVKPGNEPPIKRQAFDENAPEETPESQQAAE
jgi:tRNA A-37 threonylcarbamoyl transferase component Bud32